MAGKLAASLVGVVMSQGLHIGFDVNNNQVFYKNCNEGNGCHRVLLPGLRANSLKIYSPNGYATDGRSVYYQADKLQGVDAKSFHPVSSCWGRDHAHVYRYGKLVKGADPSTFRPLL